MKEREDPSGTIAYSALLPSFLVVKDRFPERVASEGPYHQHTTGRPTRPWRKLSVILILLTLTGASLVQAAPAVSTDPVSAALTWLISHQQSNGSYGSFSEPQTAPAMYAIWIKSPGSPAVFLGYSFLKNQLQNSTTWFWGGGGNIAEADVPGEILYSFAASHNLAMLNRLPSVVANLTRFQQPNGGFLGYFDTGSNKQVTSSVDTAMALWGLLGAKSISVASEQSAVNYLLSLQNSDGSFNLTNTVRSSPLYSLGPEPFSITALVVLVLHDASFATSDPHVSSALGYLTNGSSTNFGGHVYAASLSALAFTAYSKPSGEGQAVNYIVSQQNPDGGFRDIIRSTTGSEALDTGWATAALSCCFPANGGTREYYT